MPLGSSLRAGWHGHTELGGGCYIICRSDCIDRIWRCGDLFLLLKPNAAAEIVLTLDQRRAVEVDHAIGIGILDEDEAPSLEGILEG